MRPTLNIKKIEELPTVEELIGEKGSAQRCEFDAKARAWYYGEVLKDARKRAGLTQKQLAERIGKKREYIAMLERGETDMQLSTFLLISNAVGMRFALTY